MTGLAFALLLSAALAGYAMNRRAAYALRDSGQRLHSLGSFHGLYAALLVLVPAFVVTILWLALEGAVINAITLSGLPDGVLSQAPNPQLILTEIQSIAGGRIFGNPDPWKLEAADRMVALRAMSGWLLLASIAALSAALLYVSRRQVTADFRARQAAERIIMGLMITCSLIAVFVTTGIVLSLLFESIRFFQMVPFTEFLFGTRWEPQMPIRADQVAAVGAFGVLPVFLGTLVITTIAITISVHVGLLS
ncbi:MAG: phosphate ABC transporter permease family protein [Paracoccus sp. (in: a-proteobacteria)]|nr:phosphate ABC transporter permease family protein [Paracoccus sp. (in: a-proteobacteria)]